MLGLPPVSTAWVLLQAGPGAEPVPIALRTGPCLIVQPMPAAAPLPAALFRDRGAGIVGAFSAAQLRGRPVAASDGAVPRSRSGSGASRSWPARGRGGRRCAPTRAGSRDQLGQPAKAAALPPKPRPAGSRSPGRRAGRGGRVPHRAAHRRRRGLPPLRRAGAEPRARSGGGGGGRRGGGHGDPEQHARPPDHRRDRLRRHERAAVLPPADPGACGCAASPSCSSPPTPGSPPRWWPSPPGSTTTWSSPATGPSWWRACARCSTRQRRALAGLRTRAYSLAGEFSALSFADLVSILELGRRSGTVSVVTKDRAGHRLLRPGPHRAHRVRQPGGPARLRLAAGPGGGPLRVLARALPDQRVRADHLGVGAVADDGERPHHRHPAGQRLGLPARPGHHPGGRAAPRAAEPVRRPRLRPRRRQPPPSWRRPCATASPSATCRSSPARSWPAWTEQAPARERFHVLLVADLAKGVSTHAVAGRRPLRALGAGQPVARRQGDGPVVLPAPRAAASTWCCWTPRSPALFLPCLRRSPSLVIVAPPDGDGLSLGTKARFQLSEIVAYLRPARHPGRGQPGAGDALRSVADMGRSSAAGRRAGRRSPACRPRASPAGRSAACRGPWATRPTTCARCWPRGSACAAGQQPLADGETGEEQMRKLDPRLSDAFAERGPRARRWRRPCPPTCSWAPVRPRTGARPPPDGRAGKPAAAAPARQPAPPGQRRRAAPAGRHHRQVLHRARAGPGRLRRGLPGHPPAAGHAGGHQADPPARAGPPARPGRRCSARRRASPPASTTPTWCGSTTSPTTSASPTW